MPHEVLWSAAGEVHDINNQGQVVGLSSLPGSTYFHGFLWERRTGMQDLGTLPGDFTASPSASMTAAVGRTAVRRDWHEVPRRCVGGWRGSGSQHAD